MATAPVAAHLVESDQARAQSFATRTALQRCSPLGVEEGDDARVVGDLPARGGLGRSREHGADDEGGESGDGLLHRVLSFMLRMVLN